MKYIGPFFRINTLTTDEIKYQLFHLSKESIKHIELQSRCGVLIPNKLLKKLLSTNDINIIKDFSPVVCLYKKAHPLILKSGKHPYSWDSETFRKNTSPDSDAFLTYSILELSKYYSLFEDSDDSLFSLSKIYNAIAKIQLDFYSTSLRNLDGLFVEKKNAGETYIDTINFINKEKTVIFSYQAFMMCAYYNYYISSNDTEKDMYKNFSLEILSMLIDYKTSLYEQSTEECCKLCLAFNMFISLSKNEDARILLIDLCDELIDRFENKNSVISSLSDTCFMCVNLFKAYENTNIYKFKDKALKISQDLLTYYNRDKNIIDTDSDKKEIKYSCIDLTLYLVDMIYFSKYIDNEENNIEQNNKNKLLANMFKSLLINSGILTSFPDAPDLNSAERYKNFSFNAEDLIEEGKFKLSSIDSPTNTNIASIFLKSVSYSKKKNEFSHSKSSFECSKNMFLFSLLIYLFRNDFSLFICNNKKPMINRKSIHNKKSDNIDKHEKNPVKSEKPIPKLTASLNGTSLKDFDNTNKSDIKPENNNSNKKNNKK